MIYKPTGVCSQAIDIELDGDTIKSVSFTGGCNGNLQGIGALVQGMKAKDAIARLRGINADLNPPPVPINWQRH